MNLVAKIILLVFLNSIAQRLFSQTTEKPVNSDPEIVLMTKYVEAIKTNTPVQLDSVLNPYLQQQFRLLPDKAVFFSGYDPYFYWFRFYINNSDTLPLQLYILMGPIGERDAELFQSDNGKWKSCGKNGNQYRLADRAHYYPHTVFPLTLRPSSTDTFYMRMDEKGNFKTFAFALVHPQKLKKIESRVYFLFGIMIGILLLFAALNVYLFFSLKDKMHAWYSLYNVSLIFLLMKNEGLDQQFLGLDSETAYRLSPIVGIGAVTIFLLVHVVQLFLNNIPGKSFIHRLTIFIKFNILISAISHFIIFYLSPGYRVEEVVFEWANKSTIAGVLIILVNCVVSFSKGFKPALFILAGSLVFLLGSMERLLVISTPTYMFPPSLFQTGMVIEAGIISFALMYRYNLFKKEKESLALELEKRRSEAGKEVLLAQETERKRIAEDLHDELGSSLAALKLKLQKITLPNSELRDILYTVDKASDDTRNIAHNLMPPEFEKTSLKDLLSSYYSKLNTETIINFTFHSFGSNHHFSKEEELVVYRIIMELTNNILKHSEATDAVIQLIYYEGYLELMAEDNGKGVKQRKGDGIGLKNTRSRVNYLSGTLQIDSHNGTTIIIQIPYKDK